MSEAITAADEADGAANGVRELAARGLDMAVDSRQQIAAAVGDLRVMDADLASVGGGGQEVEAEGGVAHTDLLKLVVVAGGFEADAAPLARHTVVGQGDVGVDAVEAIAAQGDGAVARALGFEGAGHDEQGLVVEVERGPRLKGEGDALGHCQAVIDQVGASGGQGGIFGVRLATANDPDILPEGL